MGTGMCVPVRRALVLGSVAMSGVAGRVAIPVLSARAGFAVGGGGAGFSDGGSGAGFRTPTLPASVSPARPDLRPSERHVRRAIAFPGLEPRSACAKSAGGAFAVRGARLAVGAGVPAAESAARFRDPAERGRVGGEGERTQVKVNADEGGARTMSGSWGCGWGLGATAVPLCAGVGEDRGTCGVCGALVRALTGGVVGGAARAWVGAADGGAGAVVREEKRGPGGWGVWLAVALWGARDEVWGGRGVDGGSRATLSQPRLDPWTRSQDVPLDFLFPFPGPITVSFLASSSPAPASDFPSDPLNPSLPLLSLASFPLLRPLRLRGFRRLERVGGFGGAPRLVLAGMVREEAVEEGGDGEEEVQEGEEVGGHQCMSGDKDKGVRCIDIVGGGSGLGTGWER